MTTLLPTKRLSTLRSAKRLPKSLPKSTSPPNDTTNPSTPRIKPPPRLLTALIITSHLHLNIPPAVVVKTPSKYRNNRCFDDYVIRRVPQTHPPTPQPGLQPLHLNTWGLDLTVGPNPSPI